MLQDLGIIVTMSEDLLLEAAGHLQVHCCLIIGLNVLGSLSWLTPLLAERAGLLLFLS